TPAKKSQALVEAYRLYLEQSLVKDEPRSSDEPVLSFTRAWMLIRFFDSKMVQLSQCSRCTGSFVAHAHDPQNDFVCAICRPPPRAGKTRARALAAAPAQVVLRAARKQAGRSGAVPA